MALFCNKLDFPDLDDSENLTPVEELVLEMWYKRYRAKEIAKVLNITASAVNDHCQRAREKLDARSTAEAALIARERKCQGRFRQYVQVLEQEKDAVNRRDFSAIESLYDVRRYTDRGVIPRLTLGWEGSLAILERYFFGFHYEITNRDYLHLPDNSVLCLWEVSGLHVNEFFGIKKTGNSFHLEGRAFYWFSDENKIIRSESDWDSDELLMKLNESPYQWWKWFYQNDEFILPSSVLADVTS